MLNSIFWSVLGSLKVKMNEKRIKEIVWRETEKDYQDELWTETRELE